METKITIDDFIKAKQGDFDAQEKIFTYTEHWYKDNGVPYYFSDMYDFSKEDLCVIGTLADGYDFADDWCNRYTQAVKDGTLKIDKSGHPYRASMNKFLSTNPVKGTVLSYSDYQCPKVFFNGFTVYLERSASVFHPQVGRKVIQDIYDVAKQAVLDRDVLVELHREAYSLYRKVGNAFDDIFTNFGWTTAGYRGCGNCLIVWNGDEENNESRLLTEPELRTVISICKEYLDKNDFLCRMLAEKHSICYLQKE